MFLEYSRDLFHDILENLVVMFQNIREAYAEEIDSTRDS